MSAAPHTVDRARLRRELLGTWAVGLVVSAALGLGAALLRSDDFWLVFTVFAACALGPCVGLAWLLVGAGRRAEVDARAEENVETRWFEKAAAGALLDVLMAAGLLAGAMSVFGFALPGDLVLLGIWAFALADGGLRFAVLRRRES